MPEPYEVKPSSADRDPNRWLTVVPAYGRDYTTPEAVLADWAGGKDFQINDVGCAWNGSYTSTRDHGPGVTIKARYNRLADFVIIRNNEIVPGSVSDEASATTGGRIPDEYDFRTYE